MSQRDVKILWQPNSMLMIYSISSAYVPLNGSLLYGHSTTFTPVHKPGTFFSPIQCQYALCIILWTRQYFSILYDTKLLWLSEELRGKWSEPEQSSFLTHHHHLSCLPTVSLVMKELWCRLVLTLFSLCLRLQNQTRTTSFSKWRPSAMRTISCEDGLLFSTKFLSNASFAPRLRKWIKNTFLVNCILK